MNITDEQLLTSKSIHINGVGELFQPIVSQISTMGQNKYMELLLPFVLTKESSNVEFDDIYNFIFLEGNEALLQQIAVVFHSLFKVDMKLDIIDNDYIFKIGEDGIINRDNFSSIQEIVRKVHCIKLPEPEKLPENMSPEKLRIHEKMKFHRNRRAKIDEPTFKEIINTVVHRSGSFIPYDVVANFTYYQLINSYQVIVGLSNYDEYMGYKLSPKYELKEDMPSWQKIIKMI